jgi:hypothetical protein
VIKDDIFQAFKSLWSLDFRSFYLINQVYMVLLRKRQVVDEVKDYWPIRLIHCFSKLFAKCLSVRLAPYMSQLVKPNQSAFIRGRAIHDNFCIVQTTAKLLHARKCSCVLLKVDIARAFDMVSWAFLIDLLRHLGFSQRWMNWVSILLSTASTRVLLNGTPAHRICHAQGLRQGDLLSPLLFVLVMEAPNTFFHLSDARGLLQPLRVPSFTHRLSLYVDDLVIFIKPTSHDLRLVQAILSVFAVASELRTNTSKCQFTPIQCTEEQIELVQQVFPCQLVHFPCTYLGVPLSIQALNKADLQPLVDIIADRLPTWRGHLMSRAGRTTLTKVTLSVVPIHVCIAVKVYPWILHAIDKLQRDFI